MASAIPSSFTFEMLSRLPPQSFVAVWKEWRPDTIPQQEIYRTGGADAVPSEVNINLRAAPNEMLLNTEVYLSGSSYAYANVDNLTTPTLEFTKDGLFNKIDGGILNQAPFHYFSGSVESFNSGSLPFLDNQDPLTSHQFNELRKNFIRRNESELSAPKDCENWSTGLGSATSIPTSPFQYNRELAPLRAGTRYTLRNTTVPANVYAGNGVRNWRIPLGLYSNTINTHSIIPIGLFSSYSVNGWQVRLYTATQQANAGHVAVVTPVNIRDNANALVAQQAPTNFAARMRDIRVYGLVIRILDPAVMESIMGLYEKRETVKVGSVSFPLSMRLNTIGFRRFNISLYNGQSDYQFRLAGTDRSVRAFAWKIYNRADTANGTYNIIAAADVPVVNRIETNIGTEIIHPPVEDRTPNTSNVNNFVINNINKSGCLFSPLPYYQEGRKFDGRPEDLYSIFNNMTDPRTAVVYANGASFSNANRSVGMVSLENLDRREAEYSGSFQASGKDLTNVGAIEVKMRIQYSATGNPDPALANNNVDSVAALKTWAEPVNVGNYNILFVYAYDAVMELSPTGVMDITNAVL
jgi:hypothetical protein